MKKRLLMILTLAILLVGCGNQQETNSTTTEKQTTTEAPHEHTYTESTTKEATCTEAGEKTFTCDCGDTYTEQIEAIGHSYEVVADSAINATCETDGKEADTKCSVCTDVVSGAVIPATGHNYGDYVYNNDATYEADGTETATCVCGSTDTRTASGTKLELPAEPNMYGLTFEEWSSKFAHWYSMVDQDVYFEPYFKSPVIGTLSINDEVKITGNSINYNEAKDPPYTGNESPSDILWYRIDYNGQTGYVPKEDIWRAKRDTSIELNPMAWNYPTVDGLGSNIYPPTDGNWYYVYGASHGTVVKLNPYCEFAEIYDGPDRNVIGTITDTSVSLQLTGHAYTYYQGGGTGHRYIYEVYYNGQIAYIDDLTTYSE